MCFKRQAWTIAGLAGLLTALAVGSSGAAQETRYTVGPQDVLVITLLDQPDLSGKYTVQEDGTLMFPLVGRVETTGLTLREIEQELRTRLMDGFFKTPQVSVSVEQYLSRRIFVVGEVRQPGTYSLAGEMRLLEALSRAGSTTADAKGEVLVVRTTKQSTVATGPVLPGEAAASEVLKVDLHQLQNGAFSNNLVLVDGDTVVVPRAETVFIIGQVRSPGAYTLRQQTTLLQALSLAGGLTDRGAEGRIKIVRRVAGREQDVKVKLNELVQPGDTIVVPEKYF